MVTKHEECNSCQAVFKVKHDMDKKYYKLANCPFCGESLENEEFDIEDQSEEE